MTATTDFIAELIRAANEVGKLGAAEKRRLLVRAVTTIRDLREQTGIRPGRNAHDHAGVLLEAAVAANDLSGEEVAAALLEAANIIRTLKIVLDGKDEVTRGE